MILDGPAQLSRRRAIVSEGEAWRKDVAGPLVTTLSFKQMVARAAHGPIPWPCRLISWPSAAQRTSRFPAEARGPDCAPRDSRVRFRINIVTRTMAGRERYLSGPQWDAVMTGPLLSPAGATLIPQGTVPTTVYVVDEGVIKLGHLTADGCERVIDVRCAPAILGVPFALVDRPCDVEVTTVSRCRLRASSAAALVAASLAKPDMTGELLHLHALEIVSLYDRAVAMSLKASNDRLSHYMAKYPSREGSAAPFSLPVKQALMASLINVTPEHLSRLLKKRPGRTEPRNHPRRA